MAVPDQDEINRTVMNLRLQDGKSYREIAKETGLSLAAINKILHGIPKPFQKKEEAAESKNNGTETKPSSVQGLLSDVNVSKLFALAVDEGFSDPNEWLDKMLIPWLKLKRDFEWKLGKRLNPIEFGGWLELCILDSIELKDLKERINKIASHPEPRTEQPSGAAALPSPGARA